MTSAPLPYDAALHTAVLSRRQSAVRAPSRRPLLLRIIDAVADSNRRKADREIERYIERNGGRLTDNLERDIERSFR
jgi:hypothetical protein